MDQANFDIVKDQIKAFMTSYQENPFLISLKRLASLHKRLERSLKESADPFVNDMVKKMEDALNDVLGGQEDMLLSADKDSYHTLLWKLHQYLIQEYFSKN